MFLNCIAGVYLPLQRHYYYTGFREHYRFPWEKRDLKVEIKRMTEVEQEERKTVFENLSREIGFLGVPLLHKLNALYGFYVLSDLVFDAMHLVSLNIVKRRVQYWLSNDILAKEEFGERLKWMPWSKGTVCVCICVAFFSFLTTATQRTCKVICYLFGTLVMVS